MRPLATALACLLAAGLAAAQEPIDHCASVLGSISVELRIARALPPGRKTTYFCAKRYTPLIGATRDRVLRALGPPDTTGEDGAWSYYFSSRHAAREPGTPRLLFRFDDAGVVEVDCRRSA